MLGTEEGISKFLGVIDNEDMRITVQKIFDQCSTSLTKWEAFIRYYRKQLQNVSVF
jgi:hypothetical protein